MAQQSSGEFASTDPATRTQDAGFQESGFSPKISLNARSRLQHFQRPASSHLSKNAPSLQGHGDADVARSRCCGVSLTCQQICYVLYLVTWQCQRQANPRREKAGAIFFGEPCKAIA